MKTLIIGAGAAGLIAAYFAAEKGNNVFVYEKNEKAGKKIYITGKGRCNVTNDCEPDEYIKNVVRNPKFTYSVINAFSPSKVMQFFTDNGLALKTERGRRVFPVSDKSSDVIKTLVTACVKKGVIFNYNSVVENVVCSDGKVAGITVNGKYIDGDSVIICTGGISYSLTGSTGDGYTFAKKVGHKIVDLKPALTGVELNGDFHVSLQGLTLKNVTLSAFSDGKKVFSEMGELLFTHFGISGPIVLSCSSLINRKDEKTVSLFLDLKPALTENTLDNRLIKEFETFNKKSVLSAMYTLEPKSLATSILNLCNIPADKKCSEITAKERSNIVKTLKNLRLSYKSLRPIDEAIVTSGGVCVDEINPKTMESKIVKGLFFAGEVIDVDAFTGGYNLQTAFSTGFLAGKNS